jgi:hypothetical protein
MEDFAMRMRVFSDVGAASRAAFSKSSRAEEQQSGRNVILFAALPLCCSLPLFRRPRLGRSTIGIGLGVILVIVLSWAQSAHAQGRGGGGMSAFGNSGFGSSGFGGSGFGNSGFGSSGFGNSGFGSGFGNSGFGNSGFGRSGFGNSGFGNSGFGMSGFGNSGFGNSGFGGGYGGGQQFVGRDATDMQNAFQQTNRAQTQFFNNMNRQMARQNRNQRPTSTTSENPPQPMRMEVRVAFHAPRPTSAVVANTLRARLAKILGARGMAQPVVTMQGDTAVLSGVAASDSERLVIGQLAALEQGVREVRNEMTVAGEAGAAAVQ